MRILQAVATRMSFRFDFNSSVGAARNMYATDHDAGELKGCPSITR